MTDEYDEAVQTLDEISRALLKLAQTEADTERRDDLMLVAGTTRGLVLRFKRLRPG